MGPFVIFRCFGGGGEAGAGLTEARTGPHSNIRSSSRLSAQEIP